MMRARRVKGHKRHIITDTQGNLVHAIVHTADIHDRDEAPLLLQEIVNSFPWLRHVFAWRLCWQQTQRRTAQDRQIDYRDHRAFGYCQRLRRPPSPKGGRAHTGVAQPQPPPRQGLRSNHRPGNRVVICLVNPIVFTTHRKTMNLRQIGLNQTLKPKFTDVNSYRPPHLPIRPPYPTGIVGGRVGRWGGRYESRLARLGIRHMSTRGFVPVSPVHAFPKKKPAL